MPKLQIGRNYNNNLRVGGKFPLDDREVVEFVDDLRNINTWLTETGFNAAYYGMQVFVIENGNDYKLIDRDGDPTGFNSWKDITVLQSSDAESFTIDIDFSKYITAGLHPTVHVVTDEDEEEFNKLNYSELVSCVFNRNNYSNLRFISGRSGNGYNLMETLYNGDGYIYYYFGKELTIRKISSNIRSFTQAEWDALTTAQQNSYTLAIVT